MANHLPRATRFGLSITVVLEIPYLTSSKATSLIVRLVTLALGQYRIS